MATVFDDILLRGVRKGELPGRTQRSRDWFRQQAKTSSVGKLKAGDVTDFNKNVGLRDYDRFRNRTSIGEMFFFNYDPKNKSTLPYYDRFPLIFKVQNSAGGFEGLNLHYLPHVLRARLMDALYTTATNKRYDASTKLGISYGLLRSAAKYKEFKPTYKKYLTKHVRSRFIKINASEWDIALFLPVERFEKASKSKVWGESRRAI